MPSVEWTQMLQRLGVATEQEAATMLHAEKTTKNRLAYVTRIYGRYNILREERERKEFTKETKDGRQRA